MPPELRDLLDKFLKDIALESSAMAAGRKSVDEWQQVMGQNLLIYHMAAMMEGRGQDQLSPQAQALVNRLVGEQLDYLNGFADEVDATGWQDKYTARAALYAGALKGTYSRGATYGYDLPAHPTESSPCMVNCQCMWEMDEQDAEELNADFYWRLGASEHCSVCKERAQKWAPLRFRGGEQI